MSRATALFGVLGVVKLQPTYYEPKAQQYCHTRWREVPADELLVPANECKSISDSNIVNIHLIVLGIRIL